MLTVSRLGKSFGGRTLFEGVSLQLNVGSRYGLVGANGSGKTTFLKILAGDEPASDGTVTVPSRARMGVLRQDQFLDDSRRILDVAMMGDAPAWRALEERSRIIDGDGDAARLADLEDTLATLDGYTLEARASSVLEGLGIPVPSHRELLSTLSGGFKLRVLLAQVLVGGPDVLLLDEPTNHLDILSIRWLEKFLAGYRGAALVISHDQRFLDNAVTHVLDVDYETITAYTGNYTAFAAEKVAVRAQKEAGVERAEKLIAEKRAFVERFGAKATKARQAQSRLKQIEKIHVEDLADTSRQAPLFRFTPERASGKDVLEVATVSKAFGTKTVLRDVSLTVRRGEKVAVIGPNGLGKSTLLKIVMGRLTPESGTARFGHEVRAGYFAQDHHELLGGAKSTPLEYVWEACPKEGTATVRGQLGRMLFSGEDVDKPLEALSGGEAARLIFCRIIVEKPNFLVLDEPTNHLDLESIGALVRGLGAFDGTVLFVSHDRWFVSALATRILEVTTDGIRDFPGTYTEYLQRCGDDHLDADAVVLKAKATKSRDSNAPSAGPSWEEQKRRRNRLQVLPGRRDAELAAIEAAEAEKRAIATLYAEEGFFERTPPHEIERLGRREVELAKKIEGHLAEWEEIERELAALGGKVSFDPSSRSRLGPRDLPRFSGGTLFDRVARVLCHAGCLPRKELFEAWEVARRARRRLRGGRVVDLACGHALVAHLMLLLDDTSETALAVDQRIPESAARIAHAMASEWPRLAGRITVATCAIADVEVSHTDLLVSAHACGTLTDDVITRAIGVSSRVVVLPCCHSTEKCDRGGLHGWMDPALAIDATRVARLRAHGYRVHTQVIPASITPKNRLILAAPGS